MSTAPSSPSSRRSSHSTHPGRWRRTISTSKSQQPASVSLVFAQPEQGSKLRSAIDQLPTHALDDTSSTASIRSKKRERLLSTSTVGRQFESTDNGLDRKRTRTQSTAAQSPDARALRPPVEERIVQRTQEDTVDDAEPETATPSNTGAAAPSETSSSNLEVAVEGTVPFPSTEREQYQSSTRSSWFGSLSRARGKDSAKSADTSGRPTAQEVFRNTLTPTGPPSEDALQDSVSSQATIRPQLIPIPRQSIQVTEESSNMPSPQVVPSPSLTSVDEEVPRPRLSTNSPPMEMPRAEVHHQGDPSMGRKPSVSDLNPSTSRFTLRLPLLGRPKVPLQEAVKNAEVDGSVPGRSDVAAGQDAAGQLRSSTSTSGNKNSESPSQEDGPSRLAEPEPGTPLPTKIERAMLSSVTSPDPESPSQAPPEPPSVPLPVPESAADSSAAPRSDGSTPNADEQHSHSSSWWDYVGWGYGAPPLSDKPAKPSNLTIDPDRANAELEVAPPTSPTPPEMAKTVSVASAPPTVQRSPVQSAAPDMQASKSTDGIGQTPVEVDQKPPSIMSAETMKSKGSVWYSPWAWYSMSPNPTDASPSADQASEARKDEGDHVMTESEMVKEQALARDDASVTQGDKTEPPVIAVASDPTPPSADTAMSPSGESHNPIESSITTSRSGWVSFFMSKGLLTKSVTEDGQEKDENGMEVMHIDDEDDKQEGPSAPVAIMSINDRLQVSHPGSLPSKDPVLSARREHAHKKSIGSVAGVDGRKGDLKQGTARTPSPAPSKASSINSTSAPRPSSLKNLVLPTWEQTFLGPPRSQIPPKAQGKTRFAKMSKTISLVSDVLFNKDEEVEGKWKGKEREKNHDAKFIHLGKELPKALSVIGETLNPYMLSGGCRVVVIGVAGWSPGAVTRTLAGGLPSSSSKFVDMTCQALEQFEQEHSFKFKKITRVPLEGDGTIERKVSKVHDHLLSNEDWMEDLHAADAIFVAAHSQGCIVATHLLDRLVRDGHILTSRSVDTLKKAAAAVVPGGAAPAVSQAQRIGFLALCGIHLGPLRYFGTSSLLQPYIQYFEHASARELLEFQNTQSRLSKNYVKALKNVVDHGAKIVYIASLNDQVVPIYSGLFTAASHPRILRALYIDGDAYHSSDFLTNLLVLLIRILNAGLSDGGLLIHLSEATAGTLSGIGHSSVYEELATFSLAVKYFFLTTDGDSENADLCVDSFNAVEEQNDYEIPWSLRDMIADERVAHFFAREFSQLRDAFDDWQPKTTILRDVKKKLQPIQRLTSFTPSNSKL